MYIVLHPRRKMKYFKKNWSADLQEDVARMVEDILCSSYWYQFIWEPNCIQFKERYEAMNHLSDTATFPTSTLDTSSDYNMSDDDSDPTKPWLAEFECYLMTHDVVPEVMSIVEWWGVCLMSFL